ncbi:MAG: class I SAM-dependent methyltransferase [Rhodospirillales bacterium]|jgi:2-polyprenyl-3-methyl-5-hydroxy-6-metoxy-1,4-benzoquinol methylase|nr:class I SAM-dependent methyltransferase [Rhodospirillales bacterium]MBT4006529.1 class I SAM-dependent methyltransferase [Rhodospirillales bacterium]MBT5076752.1 class I SAM-dependent methyltransferase [Rhodospirillales bacterium]MBT5113807.1 class I SAM-dependent methyltransferase [Rhodospirillales bacterium]MBT5672335.1 class I SAM-dependent methyltransferase [Rhodospirillales bacterium]
MVSKTREDQYQKLIRYREEHGLESLGLMSSQSWFDDPKRLAFTLSRYKFASRMLSGCENVLEVGCGDAFASRIVLQEVERLSVTDFDPIFIEEIKSRQLDDWAYHEIFTHDLLQSPMPGQYDGIYLLDVLEHIDPEDQDAFLKNLIEGLDPHGTMIIGMPSLESQVHASDISKAGHVNCQSLPHLREEMGHLFHNVYMFSMNDEVVHTGFHKMAHYIFALCSSKK